MLYAGTNIITPLVNDALAWGWGALPAMGQPYNKDQPGTDHISALETLVERQLCELFGGKWAEARLASCTIANIAAYHAFARSGDTMVSASKQNAGHVSARDDGAPSLFSLRVEKLPYHADGFKIDDDAAASLILKEKPSLLLLGGSIALDVDLPPKTIETARRCGTIIIFDASHVAGLIAGRTVPNPLQAGVHILTSSTYKSLGGPPGGVLIGSEESHGDRLKALVCPTLSSNYDAGRLAGLSVALSEAKAFMPGYSARMIESAQVLRNALEDSGISTFPAGSLVQKTHQFLLPIGNFLAAKEMKQALLKAGIKIGANLLPPGRMHCLRVGTQVLARLGYDDAALLELARILAMLLKGRTPEELNGAVSALARRYARVGFAFDRTMMSTFRSIQMQE
jgi:glycine hydroxymethyltransferase